ncbi:hypothetical protein NDU88_001119 [Pleurodeles waltl]|uniref:Uncharacterized protein n=1 Tax=Pleurodeles waltl TaxID=8319 RepID=A0AAV7LWQ5_PLEWA|nr:hypothetical protein NDU88_001119 [Pleurodeles waltl]
MPALLLYVTRSQHHQQKPTDAGTASIEANTTKRSQQMPALFPYVTRSQHHQKKPTDAGTASICYQKPTPPREVNRCRHCFRMLPEANITNRIQQMPAPLPYVTTSQQMPALLPYVTRSQHHRQKPTDAAPLPYKPKPPREVNRCWHCFRMLPEANITNGRQQMPALLPYVTRSQHHQQKSTNAGTAFVYSREPTSPTDASTASMLPEANITNTSQQMPALLHMLPEANITNRNQQMPAPLLCYQKPTSPTEVNRCRHCFRMLPEANITNRIQQMPAPLPYVTTSQQMPALLPYVTRSQHHRQKPTDAALLP